MTDEQRDWAKRITAYAAEHYNEDGWDYVIECFDDRLWLQAFNHPLHDNTEPCTTYEQAFNEVKWLVGLWDDRRKDVQGTAF